MSNRQEKAPTLLDDFLAWDSAKSEYAAVRSDRFSRNNRGLPSGAGADYHIRHQKDYLMLGEISRSYERNDPIIRAGLNRLTSAVVGRGFNPEPRTGDKELNDRLKDRWKAWATTPAACDASERFTFKAMEKLFFRSVIRDGDIFAVRMESGQIRAFEFDRARTPRDVKANVVHGIRIDPNFRVPLEYWFTKEQVDVNRIIERQTDMIRVPADDGSGTPKVLHLHMPDRVSQTRGVSALAPASQMIGMLDDLHFAKLVQAQSVSAYTLIKEREIDAMSLGGAAGETNDDYSMGFKRQFERFGPGQILEGEPGVRHNAFSPAVPNAEFFDHSLQILTFIAINLDLPVHCLLLDASHTNFSGFRGALDQARQRYRDLQDQFMDGFHRHVWRWQVSRFLDDPEIGSLAAQDGVDVYSVDWIAPEWQYLEPLKDVQADILALKSGITSPRRVQSARGRRWDEISSEAIEDNSQHIARAIEAAESLNTQFPQLPRPIDWREVAALPLPDGISIQVGQTEPQNNARSTDDRGSDLAD